VSVLGGPENDNFNTLTTYQPMIFTFAGYTKANAVFLTGAIGIITENEPESPVHS
jgi:hypothetical protein